MDTLRLDHSDLLVSLGRVSLFTQVPIEPTIGLLTPSLLAPVVKLFEYMLRSTYFVYDGTFYEQIDGIAMGSPLLPVIVDFLNEGF